MAVKQFLSDETIFYTDDVDGSFDDKVLATANAVASAVESGGGGASGMLITISQSSGNVVLDKNYTEIKTAIESGVFPFAVEDNAELGMFETYLIGIYGYSQDKYAVTLYRLADASGIPFISDTADGVLTMLQGE